MSVDTMAIAILLGSFFVMVFLRFPIAYAVALFGFLSYGTGTASDNDLSADGKGHQFFQSDGSSVLYYHGMSHGFRRYLGKADRFG